jgi:predicted dehydrogenase/nucleoside-diphosphate-sugar epimerase
MRANSVVCERFHRSGSDILRVAVVGTGRMARLHLQALKRVPTPHAVVAVHDVISGSAKAFARFAGAQAYESLDELLHDARPDIVHVCTPAGTHFEPARRTLLGGAHLYVEKPFVETHQEAQSLLGLARERGLRICAGHQLVCDPSFVALRAKMPSLGPVRLVDSHFAFRALHLQMHRSGPSTLAAQLLDIIPHPLYCLVAALEAGLGRAQPIGVESVSATPTELHALLRANDVYGRLSVSLTARPVASTLSVSGEGGTLTADFVRAILVGAVNPGTAPLEKIANPLVESWQQGLRTIESLARRMLQGGNYPGLTELIGSFYRAVATGAEAPLSPAHLERVTAIYERLAAEIRNSIAPYGDVALMGSNGGRDPGAPVAVVTGARGLLGKQVARALAARGYRVRGLGRTADKDDPNVHEWHVLDLSHEIPPAAVADAEVVVHAAAEVSGGFDEHQRNSIDATRNLLAAMSRVGVHRLVYISSIAVLRPPRTPWERQNENTPLASNPRRLGAYIWGKTLAEMVVAEQLGSADLAVRIVRPAALVDRVNIEFPGRLGRRLFGRWHIGLGRPGLPLGVCDVAVAGDVVAWCTARFEEAPTVLNLMDPNLTTRREVLQALRNRGWKGRVVWLPISLMAAVMVILRTASALIRFTRVERLAAWSVLKPRRFDSSLSARVLTALREDQQQVVTQVRSSQPLDVKTPDGDPEPPVRR